jgi:hypothetical protein
MNKPLVDPYRSDPQTMIVHTKRPVGKSKVLWVRVDKGMTSRDGVNMYMDGVRYFIPYSNIDYITYE